MRSVTLRKMSAPKLLWQTTEGEEQEEEAGTVNCWWWAPMTHSKKKFTMGNLQKKYHLKLPLIHAKVYVLVFYSPLKQDRYDCYYQ